jgi:hypothetical protein
LSNPKKARQSRCGIYPHLGKQLTGKHANSPSLQVGICPTRRCESPQLPVSIAAAPRGGAPTRALDQHTARRVDGPMDRWRQ